MHDVKQQVALRLAASQYSPRDIYEAYMTFWQLKEILSSKHYYKLINALVEAPGEHFLDQLYTIGEKHQDKIVPNKVLDAIFHG